MRRSIPRSETGIDDELVEGRLKLGAVVSRLLALSGASAALVGLPQLSRQIEPSRALRQVGLGLEELDVADDLVQGAHPQQ